MALKLALFIAMAVVPAIVGATNYTVGGEKGWTLGVNYTEWAEGKTFKVGDRLVFNYVPGKHNVLKVGGAAFNSCDKTADTEPLTTGKDQVSLTTAGRKWYFCAIGDHCKQGMKLFINVVEAEAPAPSPTGGNDNSAGNIASFSFKYFVGLVAVLGVVFVF